MTGPAGRAPASTATSGTIPRLKAPVALPAAEHLAAAAVAHPVAGSGLWWLTFSRPFDVTDSLKIIISTWSLHTPATAGCPIADVVDLLAGQPYPTVVGSTCLGYAVMDVDAERLLCVDRHGVCAALTGPRARPGIGFDRPAVEAALRRAVEAGPGYLTTAGHHPEPPARTELRTGHLTTGQEATFTPIWSIADRQPLPPSARIGYRGRYRGTGAHGIAISYPPTVIDAIVADHHRHRAHIRTALQRAGLAGWLLDSELTRTLPDLTRHDDLLVIDERALTADPAARTVFHPGPDGNFLLTGTHLLRWVPITPPPVQPPRTMASAGDRLA